MDAAGTAARRSFRARPKDGATQGPSTFSKCWFRSKPRDPTFLPETGTLSEEPQNRLVQRNALSVGKPFNLRREIVIGASDGQLLHDITPRHESPCMGNR